MRFEPILPSNQWQTADVHWHAYSGRRPNPDRTALRESTPEVVLRTPWEVARWLDQQTRKYGDQREVWAGLEETWVTIGDEDDLSHLRQENFRIAARGDSIHTDVYSRSGGHDLYVEAVNNVRCRHRCTPENTG